MSRTGLSALLAPFWIGETTVKKPRCTECSPPLDASPKYAVSRIRESTTSSARTKRRRRTVLSYTDSGLPKRSRERVPPGARARHTFSPTGSPVASRAGLAARSPAALAIARFAVRAVDRLELLERAPRADRHARQRRLGQ